MTTRSTQLLPATHLPGPHRAPGVFLLSLIGLVMVVGLAAGTGCSRAKSPATTPATTQAAGAAAGTAAGNTPSTAAKNGGAAASDAPPSASGRLGQATMQLGAAMQRPGELDVLVRARGPAFDATQLDTALVPVTKALRATDDVQHVWTRTEAGAVRLVIRLGEKRTGPQAEALVRRVWRTHALTQLATPTIAAIQRGQRAAAALTLIANAGRQAATSLLAKDINPATRALSPAARVWTAGAVRPYRVVQWMPPYLARYGVGIADAQRRLETALALGTTDLDTLLKSTSTGTTASSKSVHLSDLCVTVSGVGEPARGAFTGKRQVVAAIVEAGGDDAISSLGAELSRKIVHKRLRKLPKNIEHFYHALAVMQRYRLTAKPGAPTFAMQAFRARLAVLGKARIFHDAFALAGLDGVPSSLQAHAHDGQVWTVWVAVGAGLRQEEVFQRLAEIFPNWGVVPLATEHDTALGWLSATRSTVAAFLASNDAVLLGRVTKDLTTELAAERRIGTRISGPRRGKTPAAFGITRRDVARKAGVHAEDLALATQLKTRMFYAGTAAGVPVWTGLPTGVMSTRQSELPLAGSKGLIPWQRVLQLRDGSEDTPRLRIDGLPTLWYGALPHEHSATEFGTAFWMAIEQRIEPSRRLEVRSLLLGQRALSRANRAP